MCEIFSVFIRHFSEKKIELHLSPLTFDGTFLFNYQSTTAALQLPTLNTSGIESPIKSPSKYTHSAYVCHVLQYIERRRRRQKYTYAFSLLLRWRQPLVKLAKHSAIFSCTSHSRGPDRSSFGTSSLIGPFKVRGAWSTWIRQTLTTMWDEFRTVSLCRRVSAGESIYGRLLSFPRNYFKGGGP